MKRKTYKTPVMAIERFEPSDIIVTSGETKMVTGGALESHKALFSKPKTIDAIDENTDWIDISGVTDD